MAYALESMLRIRVMREDRAGKDLVSARHAREVAQVELDSRKRKLDDYAQTKDERRDRVFETILMRPVPRDEIDRVRSAISQIDEEGVPIVSFTISESTISTTSSTVTKR